MGHVFDEFQNPQLKIYGAHHLDSAVGHPEHLDDAYYEFQHPQPKTFGAHHLESIIRHPIYLVHAFDASKQEALENQYVCSVSRISEQSAFRVGSARIIRPACC